MDTLNSLLLLLLLLSTCHGEDTHTKRGKKTFETPLEASCPAPEDIEPCVCVNEDKLNIDCSKIQDEEELRGVFSAFFPSTAFFRFHMKGNEGLEVLEDGVFGEVTFQELNIQESVLETVRNDALTPSLSTLTTINITSCHLAVFPFERLPGFTSLRTLSLPANQIHSLPSLASSSLQSLDLSLNQVSYLSSGVFRLLAVTEAINLNGNHLSEVTSGTFTAPPRLSNLSLKENKISHLPSLTFTLHASPSTPGHLLLDNNNIDSVEVDAFKGVHDPSTINLSNNNLNKLEEKVWRPVLKEDITLILEGNSLSCGCDIAWLVLDPNLLTKAQKARCADGTLLTDLDPADFDICDLVM